MDALAPPPLPITRLRLDVHSEDGRPARALPGSLWRSALGPALKTAVCLPRRTFCNGCSLKPQCLYPPCFDQFSWPATPPLPTSNTPPRPYALHSIPNSEGDGECRLELRLFGTDPMLAATLLTALVEAVRQGVGDHRQPLRVTRVQLWHWVRQEWCGIDAAPAMTIPTPAPLPDPPPESLQMRLIAPLRLTTQGRPIGTNDADPGTALATILIPALVRRIGLLAWAHAGWRGDLRAIESAVLGSAGLQTRGHLQWKDGSRNSSRQRQRIPTGGLLGEIELRGPGLPTLWPWLWLGQWTHLGKGATQGLGAYSLYGV